MKNKYLNDLTRLFSFNILSKNAKILYKNILEMFNIRDKISKFTSNSIDCDFLCNLLHLNQFFYKLL